MTDTQPTPEATPSHDGPRRGMLAALVGPRPANPAPAGPRGKARAHTSRQHRRAVGNRGTTREGYGKPRATARAMPMLAPPQPPPRQLNPEHAAKNAARAAARAARRDARAAAKREERERQPPAPAPTRGHHPHVYLMDETQRGAW